MPRRETDQIDQRIGENLYRLRKRKELSRGQLGAAMRTPITPQAIIKYEGGSTRIPAAGLVELSRLLGCKLIDLFDGVEALLPKGMTALPHQRPALSNITKAMIIDVSRKEQP